jgi:hypothetical protein
MARAGNLRGRKPPRACALIGPAWGAALLALAGCSSFRSDPPPVDPNLVPTDYKARVMTFTQLNPYPLIGTREAALAPPTLQPFGNESRYVACLRMAGADFRKEKVFIFFAGEINQFVDATPPQCDKAAYQPFPELPSLLNTLSGQRK